MFVVVKCVDVLCYNDKFVSSKMAATMVVEIFTLTYTFVYSFKHHSNSHVYFPGVIFFFIRNTRITITCLKCYCFHLRFVISHEKHQIQIFGGTHLDCYLVKYAIVVID